MLSEADRKQTGSYYTDKEVAEFLSAVAVRSRHDRVLEPCFGEGVFLDACRSRLDLGKTEPPQVVGVDVDAGLVSEGQSRYHQMMLVASDFFAIESGALGTFDAVVGNPPFVRYQRFVGEQRKVALDRAQQARVQISALTSAWVPFLIHAATHLKTGGRMCVVVPYEITYARYARPFLTFLRDHFAQVRLVICNQELFPELNEKVALLLADGWGVSGTGIGLIQIGRLSSLKPSEVWSTEVSSLTSLSRDSGLGRVALKRLSPQTADLFLEIDRRSQRLGDLAQITIGYVTGNNAWFHLDADSVRREGLQGDVRLALRRGSDLRGRGLNITKEDLEGLAGLGSHLLFYPAGDRLSTAAERRVSLGEQQGINQAYKCRAREPWWRVPGAFGHDFVVAVFSTFGPRLVATDLPATNTLLVGDLKAPILPQALSAAALTSFGLLSAEVYGHQLGGGALKLEPSEARAWTLPLRGNVPDDDLQRIEEELRRGRVRAASDLADALLLRKGMGLKQEEVDMVRQSLTLLRSLRLNKRETN